MKKRLYIHIGAGKTGSSAIQESLAQNKDALFDNGILIPGCKLDMESTCLGEQIWFFQNGVKEEGFKETVNRRIGRLNSYMAENNLHTMVISAENLINPEGFPELFVGMQDDFDVKIVCYIRRQDDYMISAWQQWYLKAFESFDDYVNKMAHRVNWHAALEPWREAFGQENMMVKVYEKENLAEGNAIDDFRKECGLIINDWKPVENQINRSVDEKFNSISNKYRSELFKSIHDNDFYQFLFDCFGDKAFKNYKGSSLLSLPQRQNLMARFDESNNAVLSQYFPDSDKQSLFKSPEASDIYVRKADDFEGDLDYMLVGMFGLYKKMQKMAA